MHHRSLGREGCGERAARLWGAAECLREAIGLPAPRHWRETSDRSVAAARRVMSEGAFDAAWQALVTQGAFRRAARVPPSLGFRRRGGKCA